MRRLIRVALLPLAALAVLPLLEGCSTLLPSATEAPAGDRTYHDRIAISGRFSVSYSHEGRPQSAQGRFQWHQRGKDIDIDLLSPLGQTLARILITPGSARLEQPGQPARVAAGASELTEQVLGWPMPADGLRDWLQGFSGSASGSRRAVTRTDAEGFQAEGWTVRHVSWAEHDGGTHPRRIDLARAGAEAGAPAAGLALRLVIDGWEPR